MQLPDSLYMVRMQEEQIAQAPWDDDASNVHNVTVYYKQLANKRGSPPGLYRLGRAKIALKHWKEQHPDNKLFSYKFDILPVDIHFLDPL